MKTLYLCGPIFGRSDNDAKGWRDRVAEVWAGRVLDPMRRDYRGREMEPGIAAEIVSGDIDDINNSDALLVYYDKPSVGTSMEIFYARHVLDKPVVIINASGSGPSPWLLHHSTAIVSTVDEALNILS